MGCEILIYTCLKVVSSLWVYGVVKVEGWIGTRYLWLSYFVDDEENFSSKGISFLFCVKLVDEIVAGNVAFVGIVDEFCNHPLI